MTIDISAPSHSQTQPPPMDAAQILHQRAVHLARPSQNDQTASLTRNYLRFRLRQNHYAIALTELACVLPPQPVTPLPDSPSFLLGIIHTRGRLLPVIHLQTLLGSSDAPSAAPPQLNPFLVLAEERTTLAVPVDEFTALETWPEDQLQTDTRTLPASSRSYFHGFTPDGTPVLAGLVILHSPVLLVDYSTANASL